MLSEREMLRVLLLAFLSAAASFSMAPRSIRLETILWARAKNTLATVLTPAASQFVPGIDVPEEISCHSCIYDMILVERFSQPEKTEVGLFLPKVEGKDQKHLGIVLSIPSNYGLEGEQGRLAPIEEIAPYKIGDVVYIRDPWGIGPKDIEVGKRCFSFHKAAQITGVMKKA